MHSSRRKAVLDQPASFGWISIVLHWTTAILIIALWVIGKNMTLAADGSAVSWRSWHVSLGLSTWLILAGRIVWRLLSKHPRAIGLTPRTHAIAKFAHYLMLATLTLLLLSGPLMAWLGRGGWVGTVAYSVHLYAGNVLLVLVITHIAGAIKHLMFHQDDSVVRMLWPKR